ncbi:MAG: glycosyltransferase family 2 protein, partial [Burkholderiales bacterium]
MKLSLVITTYNHPLALELILMSLAKQQLTLLAGHEVEVLIADDGSTSATQEMVNQYKQHLPFKLIYIWHEDVGFRAATIRNRAIAQSGGDYLVFIDGDCLVPPDFLANQILLATPGYFVAGNRVLLSPKFTQTILQAKDINITSRGFFQHLLGRLNGRINKFTAALRLPPTAKWRTWRTTNWKFPKGCNVGVWKSDCLSVNGFDESFTGWGHEDADFFIRLLHLGIKIKDGRFSVPVFHIWHADNDRSRERANWQRLMARLK